MNAKRSLSLAGHRTSLALEPEFWAAAERIAAVIGCTAFEAGDGQPPFVVDFDIGVAEVTSPESVGKALEEAAARAHQKAS